MRAWPVQQQWHSATWLQLMQECCSHFVLVAIRLLGRPRACGDTTIANLLSQGRDGRRRVELKCREASRGELLDDAELLIEEALAAAADRGVRGQDVTPFVLSFLHERSGGRTLAVNRDLIVANAGLAAEVAVAFSAS